jgi:hypothetical protein
MRWLRTGGNNEAAGIRMWRKSVPGKLDDLGRVLDRKCMECAKTSLHRLARSDGFQGGRDEASPATTEDSSHPPASGSPITHLPFPSPNPPHTPPASRKWALIAILLIPILGMVAFPMPTSPTWGLPSLRAERPADAPRAGMPPPFWVRKYALRSEDSRTGSLRCTANGRATRRRMDVPSPGCPVRRNANHASADSRWPAAG